MRLYLTSTGEWTGNQSDAAGLVRANGGTWEQIDVPTDQPGLIAWLTQQWTRFPTIAAPSAPITAPTATDAQRAESLRRISIEDEIQNCDLRSDERHVGKESVSTCRSRCGPYH